MYGILGLLCFRLALSKSIILPDYLPSDLAFDRRIWQRLTDVEAIFLKRFCAGWEQIIKNIPRAITMYHDHRKSSKY